MEQVIKKNGPLVSVNMVSYNSEKYIGKSIQSILNQTYKNFELIIVNDGSNDNTLTEINNFSDSRIKVINNNKNLGIPYARNIAINASIGKYIAIQDSDDVSLENRLRVQVSFLENNLDFGLIGSKTEMIDSNDKRLNRIQSLELSENETKVMLFFKNCFTHSSVMYRKNNLKKVMFNHNFKITQDYDAIIKISRESKVKNCGEVLVQYRHHANSISNNNLEKKEEENIIIGLGLIKLGIKNSAKNIFYHSKLKIRDLHKDMRIVFEQLALLEKYLLGNKRFKIFPEPEFSDRLVRYWNNIMNNSCQYSLKLLVVYINSPFLFLTRKSFKGHLVFIYRCIIKYKVS